jgi:hypothetical protein
VGAPQRYRPNATIGRAAFLEGALKLKYAPEDAPDQGGLMRSRPADARNLGRAAMRHDRALAIIYGAVLGSWMFPLFQAIVPSRQWIYAVARPRQHRDITWTGLHGRIEPSRLGAGLASACPDRVSSL